MTRRRILRNQRGATAVEFALAAPVFLGMLIGLSQLGILFFADAGIQHAVESAARTAAVYPTPSEAKIRASFDSAEFGMKGVLTPTITEGESADGMAVMDISLSYLVPLDFIFFQTPPVTLTHSRRVFVQEASSSSGSSSSSSSSTSGGTTTSTGGTTSTGSTTSGGTTSTGSTSSGGTTSASSTSSGGTTSASSTSSGSTGSSSGNGSSGNGNGSSGNGNGSSGNGNGSSGNNNGSSGNGNG